MTRQKTQSIDTQDELLALVESFDYLSNDLYVNGEPLTPKLRKKLEFAETLEEAMANMERNRRKQEESKQ